MTNGSPTAVHLVQDRWDVAGLAHLLPAAATMLQTAAKTALQLGEKNAATVLQTNATRLQVGEELSEGDLKKTRIIAKTRLQTDE